MLISHKKEFIFIHIFKTAGTSVTDVFVPYARIKDRLAHQYFYSRKLINGINRSFGISDQGSKWFTGYHKHAPVKELKKKLPPEVFNQYFKFAFVRNPYDWLASYYFYIRASKYHPLHKTLLNLKFNEFIPFHLNQYPPRQIDFITDEKKEIIIDYIGHLKKIDRDIQKLGNLLNISIPKVRKKNITKKAITENYLDLYSHNSLSLVNDYYHEDFEFLGYKKHLI